MRYTLFNTPVISPFAYWLARLFLFVIGWKPVGEMPKLDKYVMTGAHHTSNWDFVLVLAFAFYFRINVNWMGKDSLFRGRFGPFFRWTGGIPVDRKKSTGLVAQTIEAFKERDKMILVIAPEGTRTKVNHWKTGFYTIAAGAGVPIVLGVLDYKKKEGGAGPLIWPTGDYETDMTKIRDFYATVTARHPERSSLPDIRRE